VRDLAFDGDVLYLADDKLHRWKDGALETVSELPPRLRALGENRVADQALSADGRWRAEAYGSGVRLWSSGSFRELPTRAQPVRLVFSGDRLAAQGSDGSCQLWTLATGEATELIRNGSGAVGDLAFSPDGRYVAASRGAVIRLWDLTLGGVRKLHGHRLEVTHLAFSDDGSLLASASLDGTVRMWQIAAGAPRAAVALLPGVALAAGGNLVVGRRIFGPDGRALDVHESASISSDGRQVTLGKITLSDDDVVTSLALLGDDTVALGLRSGAIRLRTTTDPGYLLHGPPSPVVALAATSDGLLAVHGNGAARLWPPPPPAGSAALLAAIAAMISQ
jgi:hypothetical protein